MLVPRLPGLAGRGSETALLLNVARDDATLTVNARGRVAATLPLSLGSADVHAPIPALLRRHHLNDRVAIRLDPTLVLRTTIDLPAAASALLRPIVEHQLERLVPMAPSDVCFACRIERQGSAGIQAAPTTATLSVTVAIIKRSTLDRALQLARSAGITPRIVAAAPSDADNPEASPFVFWRADRAGADPSGRRRLRRSLEAAACCAAISAYGLYVLRLDQVRDDLRRQVAIVTQDARKAQEVSRTIAATSDTLGFFEARRRDLTPLRVLDTLTRLVPDDTWADNLVVRGRTAELTGVSPHAADLIGRFESSAVYDKPEFRSPITLSPDGKGERFVLTFGIRPAPP